MKVSLPFGSLMLCLCILCVPHCSIAQTPINSEISEKWQGVIEAYNGQDTITGRADGNLKGVTVPNSGATRLDYIEFRKLSHNTHWFASCCEFEHAATSLDPFGHISHKSAWPFLKNCAGTYHFVLLHYGSEPFLYGYFESDNPIFKNEHHYLKAILFKKSFVESLVNSPLPDVSSLLPSSKPVAHENLNYSSQPESHHENDVHHGSAEVSNTASTQNQPMYSAVPFKIDAKYVTLPTDKKFRWYKWAEAPEEIQNATAQVMTLNTTLRESIEGTIADGCEVEIAATDLNFNGIVGFALSESGSSCCGSHGCGFELWEDGGLLLSELSIDYEVKPSKNGVISSAGKFFGLKQNNQIKFNDRQALETKFKYARVSNLLTVPTHTKAYAGGTITPDELGRQLLKALQTSNKKLWRSCVQPENNEDFDYTVDAFDRVRERLTESGITDWSQMKFSRVTYAKSYKEDSTGEICFQFSIEFEYKKTFLGKIGFMKIQKLNGGKWFVLHAGSSVGLL